jgi:hypothetical protein
LILVLGVAVLLSAASALLLAARPQPGDDRPPAPRRVLRILRDDHRSRHPRGTPRALRGAERWL